METALIRFILCCVVLAMCCAPPQAAAQGQYRGFWVDAVAGHNGLKTAEQVTQLVADARRAGANVLFVQVRRRGGSLYVKSLEPPYRDPAYSPDFDALEDVIAKAHAAGIQVHAWMNVSPVGDDTEAPNPRHIVALHGPALPGRENWISLSNTGGALSGGQYWMDHGHPEAAAFTVNVIEHLVRNYGVDGVHLDFIRYSEETAGNAGWGYNPASVERFNRLFLRTGSPPPGDPQWSDFRREQVTALVRRIYLRTIAFRREVRLSAALISWGDGPLPDASNWNRSAAYSRVLQNWREWLQEGILDFAVPMNYDRENDASQRAWFDRWLLFERANQGRRLIVTGVAAYLNAIRDTLAQAGRALAAPQGGNALGGVNFFSYAVTDTRVNAGQPVALNQEFYTAAGDFFASLGAVTPPVLAWKVAPQRGYAMGEVLVSGVSRSPLADGIRLVAQGPGGTYSTTVDGTGFFGWVEMEPGMYTVTGYRGTTLVLDPAVLSVRAGEVATLTFSTSREAMSAATPAPNSRGVTNAASFAAAAMAPGSLISIFGTGLAESTAAASGLPLPPSLGGTQVLINGVVAPLLYVSPLQINAQAPFGLEGGEVSLVVRRNGLESAAMPVRVAETDPGLFHVAQKADFSLISATNPAARGSVVILYGTGFGAVTPSVAAGAPAPTGATPIVAAAEARVGGQSGRVLYCGLAPGFAGLYQINIEIPADAPTGPTPPVQVIAGGRTSNAVLIPIQ